MATWLGSHRNDLLNKSLLEDSFVCLDSELKTLKYSKETKKGRSSYGQQYGGGGGGAEGGGRSVTYLSLHGQETSEKVLTDR